MRLDHGYYAIKFYPSQEARETIMNGFIKDKKDRE